MQKTTLYAKSSKNKVKQWSIWTEPGGYVYREWGFQGGKLQTTSDLVKQKNVGKSNETSLDEQAELEAQRILQKKKDEGFAEKLSDSNEAFIDWKNSILPKTFAPAKPATKIEANKENSLVASGDARYTRKHNGMRVLCIYGDAGVKIFSRRLEDKTANFPWQAEELQHFMMPGMIWDGELVWNDDPDLIKEAFGSSPAKAIQKQSNYNNNERPILVFFDCLYQNKKPLNKSWDERYTVLKQSITIGVATYLRYIEILPSKKFLQDWWEGLVLWDGSSKTHIRFDGKPDRKSGAYKIKSFKEADVLVVKTETGRGKLNNSVATLTYGAYDDNGNIVELGRGGSGLNGDMREEISHKKLPFVAEITYEELTKNNKFRLPVIKRVRDDKKPTECLLSDIEQ